MANIPNMIGRAVNSLGAWAAAPARYLFSGRGGGGGFYPIRATQIPSARFNWLAEAGDFRQNPVVALGLDWITRNATSVPLELWIKTKYGEDVQLEGHPLLDLIQNPNPIYSGHALLSATIIDTLCVGNGFWSIVPNAGGRVAELYWLDGRYMAPDFPVDGSQYLNCWKYIPAGTGRPEIFDPEQIVDFKKGIDPWNDRLGYSPLLACCREVALISMIAGYTASILKNVGVTNMVISPTGENALNKDQAETLKQSIMQSIGLDRQGQPLILTSPAMVDSIGTKPAEMMLPNVDSTAVARICSAMGVSPMVLGLPDEGRTYSNYREAQRAAWMNSIIPFHELLSASIEKKLLRLYDPTGRMFLKWNYSNIEALAEDHEQLANKATMLFKENIITRNEARMMVGLEEIECGDLFAADVTKAQTAPMMGGGGYDDKQPDESEEEGETAEATEEAEAETA